MVALPRKEWSEEEYLAIERASTRDKREYYDGDIYMMVGGTGNHAEITMNVGGALYASLRDRPCRVFSGDLKVKMMRSYVYPDVSVVCGEPRYLNATNDVLLNPTVIFEVLSPSTEQLDRTTKFMRYQTLDSLQDYLLVSQHKLRIEQYTRQGEKQWLYTVCEGLDAILDFPALGIRLALADVYRNIVFSGVEDEDE